MAAFDGREPGSLGTTTTSPETTRWSSLWYPPTSPTLYDVSINLEQNVSRGNLSQSDESKDGKADDVYQKMRREGKVSKRSRLNPGKYGYCRPDPRYTFIYRTEGLPTQRDSQRFPHLVDFTGKLNFCYWSRSTKLRLSIDKKIPVVLSSFPI